jgi:hypothetical protein
LVAEKTRGDGSCKELHGLQAQHRQVGRSEVSWEYEVYYCGNNITKMKRKQILKLNKTDNIRIYVARRRVPVTIIAVEKQ